MKIGYLNNDMAGRIDIAAPRMSCNVRFVAKDGGGGVGDKEPSHTIVTDTNGNTIELGAAWLKEKNGRRYFSCNVDQPGWAGPLSFAAFDAENGWDLTWSRGKRSE
jgi:uncharacterized protein (DUF736 family)